MSRITNEQVRHVALLSRLAVDDEAVEHFARELSEILDYIEQLQELDTTDVEPTSHTLQLVNVLAEDEPHTPLTNEQAIANAPASEDGCFKVTKVIQ